MVHECDLCGLYFPLAKTLQTHQRLLCKGRKPSSRNRDDGQVSSDVDQTGLECPYCGRVLQTKSGLTRHIRDSCPNGKKDVNDEATTSSASAASIPCESNQDLLFPCTSCGKVYKHLCSLKRHQAVCYSQPVEPCSAPENSEVIYNCPLCGKIYRSFRGLCRHRKVCASREVPSTPDTTAVHICKVCERSFDSFQGLRQHMRKAHPTFYYAEAQGEDDFHSSPQSFSPPPNIEIHPDAAIGPITTEASSTSQDISRTSPIITEAASAFQGPCIAQAPTIATEGSSTFQGPYISRAPITTEASSAFKGLSISQAPPMSTNDSSTFSGPHISRAPACTV
ncbi:hypothetical protein Zmor_003574 [Zophobas morio]|uniref:C2H2-type domain-containing protein n=1 Tax=Zophobas morio TaxID=2755281 RepID=A0AA38M1G2_9CUCU|nr:hypothetical protein Zmor_003574 [Zophobas morio]